MDLLIERHGKMAFLLLIIDFQRTAEGAAVVEGMDNIMVHFLSGSKHVNQAVASFLGPRLQRTQAF